MAALYLLKFLFCSDDEANEVVELNENDEALKIDVSTQNDKENESSSGKKNVHMRQEKHRLLIFKKKMYKGEHPPPPLKKN